MAEAAEPAANLGRRRDAEFFSVENFLCKISYGKFSPENFPPNFSAEIFCGSHCADLSAQMQLRARSQPKVPSSRKPTTIRFGRRRSFQFDETREETKSRLASNLNIEDWLDNNGGQGAILRMNNGVRVKVPAAIWDRWQPGGYSPGSKSWYRYALGEIPISILRYLRSNRTGEDMTVRQGDVLDIPGKHFIIESIEGDGVYFLVTKHDRSDRQCSFCLRRKVIDDPCSGCVCTAASLYGLPS